MKCEFCDSLGVINEFFWGVNDYDDRFTATKLEMHLCNDCVDRIREYSEGAKDTQYVHTPAFWILEI